MTSKLQLFEHIKTLQRKVGLNIRFLFEDYDLKMTGHCSPANFRRILIDKCNIFLSDSEFSSIASEYTDGSDFFDYTKFLADLKVVCDAVKPPPCDPVLLSRFVKELSMMGSPLADVVERFDKHRGGHIRVADFLNFYRGSRYANEVAEAFTDPSNGLLNLHELLINCQASKIANLPTAMASTVDFSRTKLVTKYLPEIVISATNYRYNFDEFFRTVDPQQTNVIDPRVFIRESVNFRPNLTQEQIIELAGAYTNARGEFDYKAFMDDYNAQKKIISQEYGAKRLMASARMAPPKLEDALDMLRKFVINSKDHLLIMFRQYDPRETGVIKTRDFLSVIQRGAFKFSPELEQILVDTFQVDTDQCNYMSLWRMISPQRRDSTSFVNDAVEYLKAVLERLQTQLLPHFEKYDTGKTGYVSYHDFVDVLYGATHQHFELDRLAVYRKRFCDGPNNMFDYRELCALVDPVIVHKKVEFKEEELPVERPHVYLPPPDEREIKVLCKLAEIEQKMNLSFHNEFSNIQHIRLPLKLSQFKKIMVTFKVDTRDIDLLVARYALQGSNSGEINACQLCEDIIKYGVAPEQVFALYVSKPPPAMIVDICKRIKGHCAKAQTDVLSLFNTYDHLSSGHVAIQRVESILSSVNLQLTKDEYSELVDYFSDSRIPERFHYKKISTIADAFASEDINGDYIGDLGNPSQELAAMLNLFKDYLYARRLRPSDLFKGVKENYIAVDDFKRRLDAANLTSRGEKTQMLVRRYRMNLRNDIDWKRFCHEIEISRK